MANTHGESSMEEFAAKAIPELEDLLERFKNPNKPDAPEPEPEPEPVNETYGLSDDAERIDDLAHIIWHLANQIEDIAYHNDSVGNMVTANAQCIRKDAKRIHQSFRTDDLRDF